MPANLRRGVMDQLQLIFPDRFKFTDTKADGINNTFQSVHYSWYNRYKERVRVQKI